MLGRTAIPADVSEAKGVLRGLDGVKGRLAHQAG
jgi:hypothetical protein